MTASKGRPPSKAKPPKIALGGEVATETLLPYPFVQYPGHYGAFHAFASEADGPFKVCACQRGALENLVRLIQPPHIHAGTDPEYETHRIWTQLVPPVLYDASPTCSEDLDDFLWEENLCHRCHIVSPALRWSHEMYNGQFKQYFGWYVQQSRLRLGFSTHSAAFLPDIAPSELIELRRLAGREAGNAASKARNQYENAFENITRSEFGQRNVGDRWVSETQLYQLVVALLPGEEIVRHERPEWLDGLELDVWIPGRRMGIEYQGQQHFNPIEAWGGQTALEQLQARDQKKRQMCKELGVTLIEIDYTEPLVGTHVADRLGLH